MPIDAEFLAKLRCPRTRQPLRFATAAELARVNAEVGAGRAKAAGGAPVTEPLQEGLVPVDDAGVVYPVAGGIPVLLAAEAIALPAAGSTTEG